jgi:hypothetical protein
MRQIYALPVLLIGFFLCSMTPTTAQKTYKHMMYDMQINYNDVCTEAERYFESHAKGKGSGWKGYARWKNWSEGHYYPSGDRTKADPQFALHAYQAFLKQNGQARTSFPNGWKDLGPYDANNVTRHYSPGIGRVECFYVDPTNPQKIYMGSRSGGFWRTIDGGTTWQNTTDFLFASGVNTMDADPNNSDNIFINVRNGGNGTSHGIYGSTDGGLSWTPTAFSPTALGWGGLGDNGQILKIVYHPTIPNLILVGTNRGLYRSTDNLQTWTRIGTSYDISDIDFHPTDPSIVYMYDTYYWGNNQSLILHSSDTGQTFTTSAMLTGNNDADGFIATTPACPDCVYFGSTNGIWRSDDAAQTFTFITNPNESCRGFAVSDLDSLHIVYGYVDIEASADGGYSFTQTTRWANSAPDSSYVHADLRTAECINGVFYAGTDGYLVRSPDNGVSWERLNDGTGIREFYAVGLSQSNWKVQMAGSQDNGTSILDDTGWKEWNGGDGMEAVIQPLNPAWMIGSWQYGTRQRTKDGGISRQGVSSPEGGRGYWEAPLLIDPNDQMRVYHFMDTVYVSEEFGTGWTELTSPSFSGDVKLAAIANNNSNIIAVARNENLELSTDGGITYTDISTGLPNYSITDIAFDPNDDNFMVVTYNRYQNDNQKVYISRNQGASWANATGNLGNMPIRSIVIDHTDAANIYVGGEIGVYYRSIKNLDPTWTLYNQNLPNVTVRDLKVQYGSNTLRAATWGRGLWEYSLVNRNNYPSILTTTITDPPTDELPKAYIPQMVTSVISYDNTLSSVFVQWSTVNPTYDSTIVMTNTVDSTWESIRAIPGFIEGTKVYFKVFAVGSNGDTTETYKFMYKTRENEYCTAAGSTQYNTSITEVSFNNLGNASAKLAPYTDYTTSDSAVVSVSNSYNLSVNLNTDGNYTVNAKVWIDWNQDYDFDDPNEEYDLAGTTNSPNGPTVNSPLQVAVPANAVVGKTRMRVACLYNGTPTACMTSGDGEVEDYTVVVQAINLNTNQLPVGQVQIFPNPTSGRFAIDLGQNYQSIEVEIMDISGKTIQKQLIQNQQELELFLDAAAGVYLINIIADEQTGSYKIIKE